MAVLSSGFPSGLAQGGGLKLLYQHLSKWLQSSRNVAAEVLGDGGSCSGIRISRSCSPSPEAELTPLPAGIAEARAAGQGVHPPGVPPQDPAQGAGEEDALQGPEHEWLVTPSCWWHWLLLWWLPIPCTPSHRAGALLLCPPRSGVVGEVLEAFTC